MGKSMLHTAGLLPDDVPRIEGLKVHPREPVWSVVHRLLDSYDLSHPKTPPEPREALPA